MPLVLATVAFCAVGCAQKNSSVELGPPPAPPTTVVVAPVLNLSNSSDWDPLTVSDWLASEMQHFPELTVIPVNRAAAALARWGKSAVESPADAIRLAQEFGADATVVAALTEYSPYDPPIVGIIIQWYAESTPELQIQRVFNAAMDRTRRDMDKYARERPGHDGPYGRQIHAKSQELFVRYCCWAAIQSMLSERTKGPGWTNTSCTTAR